MATTRSADAHWEGSLDEGAGTVALSTTGLATFDVTWAARSQDATDKTSPEELLAAAHATCFSMALASRLAKAGAPPEALDTRADVTFQPGEGITGIVLTAGRTRTAYRTRSSWRWPRTPSSSVRSARPSRARPSP